MKTLKSWAKANNVVVGRHAHARTVAIDAPNQTDLYRLEDYIVSSVAAGTIWLIRRHPFTNQDKNERSNFRNAAVGMTIREIEFMLINHYGYEFGRDCLEEFLFELQAEERDSKTST